MRDPLVSVRVSQETRDWLDTEESVSETVREALESLRRSRAADPSSPESEEPPEAEESVPSQPHAAPARPEKPAPDSAVELALRRLLPGVAKADMVEKLLPLLMPLAQVGEDGIPRIEDCEIDQAVIDRLTPKSDQPSHGSPGSGGRGHVALRPARNRPEGPAHVETGPGRTRTVDLATVNAMTPQQRAEWERSFQL